MLKMVYFEDILGILQKDLTKNLHSKHDIEFITLKS